MASAQPSNSNLVLTDTNAPHRISLLDTTAPTEVDDTDAVSEDGTVLSETPTRLSKRLSIQQEVRQQRNKWKYGRYTAERAAGQTTTHEENEDAEAERPEASGDVTSSKYGKGHLSRGKQKVANKYASLRGCRVARLVIDADSEIDVLYENQRGFFFFGHPYYSSNALWQIDVAAWTDSKGGKSSVNITNAQVPDPSWVWSWKNWYVDMGGDVDEEGWEYSWGFQRRAIWHGTHPWFHSYVRRRRWIRKRTRKEKDRPNKIFGDAHMMNQDYFTIHSVPMGSGTPGALSPAKDTSVLAGPKWGGDDNDNWDDKEIADFGTLMRGLKETSIDSERIAILQKFLDQGGEDLFYLADEMSKILSYFSYEASCRRILAILGEEIEDARAHREKHEREDRPENDSESRRITSLLKAAKAVDEQCRKLEYYSDVRELAKDGDAPKASDLKVSTPTKTREATAEKDVKAADKEKGPERPLSPVDVFEEKSAPVIADVFDPESEPQSQQTQDAEDAQDADDGQVFEDAQSSIHSEDAKPPEELTQSSEQMVRSQTQTTDDVDEEEEMTEVEPIPTDIVPDE